MSAGLHLILLILIRSTIEHLHRATQQFGGVINLLHAKQLTIHVIF